MVSQEPVRLVQVSPVLALTELASQVRVLPEPVLQAASLSRAAGWPLSRSCLWFESQS
jgi:hypothetical protein